MISLKIRSAVFAPIVAMALGGALLAMAAVQARAAERTRTVSGTVTAVTLASRTIVIEAKVGGTTLIVGAEVPQGTTITGAKDLADISAGDQVTIQYVRTGTGLIARSLNRLSAK
jgi:hypothetical protein